MKAGPITLTLTPREAFALQDLIVANGLTTLAGAGAGQRHRRSALRKLDAAIAQELTRVHGQPTAR